MRFTSDDGIRYTTASLVWRAEHEVLGLILGSDKVLLNFSNRNFSVAVTESGLLGWWQ